ncbi:hypothetical protein H8356DRAFT_1645835, partial [Neocallimastix lanati (nom. inval.)]
MLKKVNEWVKFNMMMNFGINKCVTMVIRPDTPLFQNKKDPTFYLAVQLSFSVSKFLSNSKIPIPFKKIIINSYVLSKVSYFAPLLGSNKARTNNTQKLINIGLRWVAGLQKAKSFIN